MTSEGEERGHREGQAVAAELLGVYGATARVEKKATHFGNSLSSDEFEVTLSHRKLQTLFVFPIGRDVFSCSVGVEAVEAALVCGAVTGLGEG